MIEEIAGRGEKITLLRTMVPDLSAEDTPRIREKSRLIHLHSTVSQVPTGDEKNPMLTRIYGLAFDTKEELDAHKAQREEAKRRDHRKLGKELELFPIIDEIGPGLPLFYPKGALLRRTIENYITDLQESRGYVPIWIPHITKGTLYEISGHLQKYDAMYSPMKVDGDTTSNQ